MLATQTEILQAASGRTRGEVGVAGWGSFFPQPQTQSSVLDWIQQPRDLTSPRVLFAPDHLEAESGLTKRELKKLDRFSILAVAAARAALASSGFTDQERTDCGIVTGNMLGGWTFTEPQLRNLHRTGLSEVSPYLATAWFPAAPQGQISIHFGMRGFAKTIATDRCAGAQAIGLAFELIRDDTCGPLLAGGVEAPCTPFVKAAPATAWIGNGTLAEAAAYLALCRDDEAEISIAGHGTFACRGYDSDFCSRLQSLLLTAYTPSPAEFPCSLLVCNVPAVAGLREQVVDCVKKVCGGRPLETVFPTDLLGDSLAASGPLSAVLICEKLKQGSTGESALLISCGHHCCDLLWFRHK